MRRTKYAELGGADNPEGHDAAVRSVGFSPDGKRIVMPATIIRSSFGTPRSGKLEKTLRGHAGWIRAMRSYSRRGESRLRQPRSPRDDLELPRLCRRSQGWESSAPRALDAVLHAEFSPTTNASSPPDAITRLEFGASPTCSSKGIRRGAFVLGLASGVRADACRTRRGVSEGSTSRRSASTTRLAFGMPPAAPKSARTNVRWSRQAWPGAMSVCATAR